MVFNVDGKNIEPGTKVFTKTARSHFLHFLSQVVKRALPLLLLAGLLCVGSSADAQQPVLSGNLTVSPNVLKQSGWNDVNHSGK